MTSREKSQKTDGFEVLRTPSGAVDFDAYQIRGRREQARALAAALSWVGDQFARPWKK